MLEDFELFNGEKQFILKVNKLYDVSESSGNALIKQGYGFNLVPEKVVQ
jgi:hypothetical protein